MQHGPETIHIADDSELARLLERVDKAPLRLEKNGVVYRVTRENDLWAGYDPEKVKRALSASRGLFAGTDTEQFLVEMHEQREQGPNRFD